MFEKTTLPNGVRLLSEPIDHVSSAAVGIWVGNGSRHEEKNVSGISHAIEHMLFKGTQSRTAAQIAQIMDGLGGQVNAFTTKECTCYYVRALSMHLETALDVLTDIFFNARFDPADWDNERKVILEEISMYEDTPEDLVSERLTNAVFKGHPLGRPILGTPDTLEHMDMETMRAYKQSHYLPGDIVVAVSGRIEKERLTQLANAFSRFSETGNVSCQPIVPKQAIVLKKKKIEQNHLCLAYPSRSYRDPQRYTLQILSNILGGGMSSRLFQRVREERGLCYSIFSYSTAYRETGLLGIYTALVPETEEEALRLVQEEIERFVQDGPTKEEIDRTREQSKANLLMGLESTSARMNHLARGELLMGHVSTPQEIVDQLDSVTYESVLSLARAILRPSEVSFSAVGRVRKKEEYKALLAW